MIPGIVNQYNLDKSTIQLLSRMTVRPSLDQTFAINSLITGLKEKGIWDKLLILHVLSAHDSQAATLNWIGNSSNGVLINSPVFTPFVGVSNTMASKVMQFNHSSLDTEFPIDLSHGVWAIGNSNARLTSLSNGAIRSTKPSGNIAVGLYAGASIPWASPSGSSTSRFISASRVSETLALVYEDGSQTRTQTFAENINLEAGVGEYSIGLNQTLCLSFVGHSLTSTEHQDLYNLLFSYMLHIGNIEGDSDAVAVARRMASPPSPTLFSAMDSLVTALKTGGAWDKLGFMHVMAVQDDQAASLDWTGNGHDLLLSNSPEFIPYRGFLATNGSAVRIFAGSWANIPNYTLTDAHIAAWEFNNVMANSPSIGYSGGGTNTSRTMLYGRGASGSTFGWLNENSTPPQGAFGSSLGFTLCQRSVDNGINRKVIYRNPELYAASAVDPIAFPTGGYYLRFENTWAKYRGVSFGSAGGAFTGDQRQAFSSAIEAFMGKVNNSTSNSTLDGIISRMDVAPESKYINAMDTMIRELQNSGIWEKLGFLHVFGVHDAQAAMLDWTDNGFDLTAFNSLTFVEGQGFTGNKAGGSYLTVANKKWQDVPGYSLNSASIGAYEFTNLSETSPSPSLSSSRDSLLLYGRDTAGKAVTRLNRNSVIGSIPVSTSVGLLSVSALDNKQYSYKNGKLESTDTGAVQELSGDANIYYLRRISAYSNRSISFGFAGAYLTANEHLQIYRALERYTRYIL